MGSMWGRCRVDVGSMWGRCRVDVRSMWGGEEEEEGKQ